MFICATLKGSITTHFDKIHDKQSYDFVIIFIFQYSLQSLLLLIHLPKYFMMYILAAKLLYVLKFDFISVHMTASA